MACNCQVVWVFERPKRRFVCVVVVVAAAAAAVVVVVVGGGIFLRQIAVCQKIHDLLTDFHAA